ncbi:hypothetical protein FSP39_008074 [Pinctada imbricata]|uniref:Ig-like domain-containing protein n=1 Tax=Pinctada imbricata TaxID=66713 RepID=A0AA89BUB9_PINIB|nr:hypothetical protein FSP39_008074 [Pinctada imbricata]
MMARKSLLRDSIVYSLVLLSVLLGPVLCQEEEVETLKVDPPAAAQQVGEEVEFTCTNSNTTNTEPLVWLYHNGTEISTLNLTRFTESDGVLKIMDIQDSDAGVYNCTTVSRALHVEVELKIYMMPSYLTEGLILMAINIGLILIFMVCALYRCIQTRRDKKKRKGVRT